MSMFATGFALQLLKQPSNLERIVGSKFQQLYEEAQRRVLSYERVAEANADRNIVLCAMRVINRHGLTQEFVDEITKPIPATPNT